MPTAAITDYVLLTDEILRRQLAHAFAAQIVATRLDRIASERSPAAAMNLEDDTINAVMGAVFKLLTPTDTTLPSLRSTARYDAAVRAAAMIGVARMVKDDVFDGETQSAIVKNTDDPRKTMCVWFETYFTRYYHP